MHSLYWRWQWYNNFLILNTIKVYKVIYCGKHAQTRSGQPCFLRSVQLKLISTLVAPSLRVSTMLRATHTIPDCSTVRSFFYLCSLLQYRYLFVICLILSISIITWIYTSQFNSPKRCAYVLSSQTVKIFIRLY